MNDLSQGLVRSFLQEIKSKLFDEFDKLTFEAVCRQMNLVEDPAEYVKPKNFALIFFNTNPEKISIKSLIEIVSFQSNIANKNLTETNLEGPVHHQLRDPLRYIKSQVNKKKLEKVSYKAEAIRYYYFPYEALENAAYHMSYEITEPVEIRVHPNRIHIVSYPRPDASIKMETLQNGKVVISRYLNRQIKKILKELKLTEEKCTGHL